jgi:hypothetical protein
MRDARRAGRIAPMSDSTLFAISTEMADAVAAVAASVVQVQGRQGVRRGVMSPAGHDRDHDPDWKACDQQSAVCETYRGHSTPRPSATPSIAASGGEGTVRRRDLDGPVVPSLVRSSHPPADGRNDDEFLQAHPPAGGGSPGSCASFAQAAQTQSVTIPFPRGGSAPVGLTNGPMLIRSVALKGRPVRHDYRWASHDRDDTTLLRWVFHLANAGRRDWHARIRVRVYSADEHLLASNDREGEVNARDWHDQITVFTKIRTLNYPSAHHVRIEAVFYPG